MQVKCVNIAQSEGLRVNQMMIEHERGINDVEIIDRDLIQERGNLPNNQQFSVHKYLLRDCQS